MTFETQLANGQLIYMCKLPAPLMVYQNEQFRWLTIDDVLQSLMLLSSPWQLTMLHHARIISPLKRLAPKRILECGLGGGNLARYFSFAAAQAEFISIESSAEVIDVFNTFFNPQKADLHIEHADIRDYLQQSYQSFDWIIADLFKQSDGLFSYDFVLLQHFSRQLNKGGCLTINLPFPKQYPVEQLCCWLKQEIGGNLQRLEVPGYQNLIIHCFKPE